MVSSFVHSMNNGSWKLFINSLLPLPTQTKKTTPIQSMLRIATLAKKAACALITLPVVVLTSCVAAAETTIRATWNHFHPSSKKASEDFSVVVNDSREWDNLGNILESLLRSPPGATNEDFLFGAASCTYQDSGSENCPFSQWASWEKNTLPPENRSGRSANFFQLYQTDPMQIIHRLQQLGVNSYRLSIEWSLIEPTQGEFNADALSVYVRFCQQLRSHGIIPMITLHHFSEPSWFHTMGSFEHPENIEHFVNFSEYVYNALTQDYQGTPLVQYFCTINEPAIEAFSRFVRGAYSPGITLNFHRAAMFLKGALKAHFTVYARLKALSQHPHLTKIGFCHQYLRFIPTNILVYPAAKYLTDLVNNATLNVFKTNVFSVQVPFLCNVVETFDPQEMGTDFVGVQNYTAPALGLRGSITTHTKEAMTTMPFREAPAELYHAIVETHKATRKPIIVTENGISTHDPKQRERYMTRALFALRQAERHLKPGAILGYNLWSLTDNFEWDLGMRPQAFGAFALTKINDQWEIDSLPKRGMESFTRVIAARKAAIAHQPTVEVA